MDEPELHPRAGLATRPSTERLRTAFRELHGRHLHGFALLMTMGDRPRAARLAADALEAGAAQAESLRHPERAATWLRSHVVRHLRRSGSRRAARNAGERLASLADLGVEPAVLAALTELGWRERALVVAEALEGLGPLDVATITGLDGRPLARLRQHAHERYARSFAAAQATTDAPGTLSTGPLGDRIRAALGGAWR